MSVWSETLPMKQPAKGFGSLDAFWSGLDIERKPVEQSPENQYVPSEPVVPSWGSSKSQVNGALDVLATLYAVPNTSAVQSFLVNRRSLRELLFGAYPIIKKFFGERVNAELRVIEDIEDNLERLRVSIISSRQDARQVLEQFDEEWWLDRIQTSEGLLNFVLRRE